MFNFDKIKKAAADLISIIVSVVIIAALVLGVMLFLSNKVRQTAMDEINNTMNTITGIAEANRNNADIVIPGGPGGGEDPVVPEEPEENINMHESGLRYGKPYSLTITEDSLSITGEYYFYENGTITIKAYVAGNLISEDTTDYTIVGNEISIQGSEVLSITDNGTLLISNDLDSIPGNLILSEPIMPAESQFYPEYDVFYEIMSDEGDGYVFFENGCYGYVFDFELTQINHKENNSYYDAINGKVYEDGRDITNYMATLLNKRSDITFDDYKCRLDTNVFYEMKAMPGDGYVCYENGFVGCISNFELTGIYYQEFYYYDASSGKLYQKNGESYFDNTDYVLLNSIKHPDMTFDYDFRVEPGILYETESSPGNGWVFFENGYTGYYHSTTGILTFDDRYRYDSSEGRVYWNLNDGNNNKDMTDYILINTTKHPDITFTLDDLSM